MTSRRVLNTADWHRPFHEQAVQDIIFHILKHNHFDVFRILGDLNDCYAISSFDKPIERDKRASEELADLIWFLEEVPRVSKNHNIAMEWIEGNHEHRVNKEQDRNKGLPKLLGRRKLYAHVMTLFNDEDIGIGKRDLKLKWIPAKSMYRPAKDFVVIHGDGKLNGASCSKWSGYSEKNTMDRYMCSGMMGHNHKVGLHWRGDRVFASIGCCCELDQGYNNGMDWHHGFAVTYESKKGVHMDLRRILNGEVVWNGSLYTATGKEKL